jgi:phenylacetate-CoA ligase
MNRYFAKYIVYYPLQIIHGEFINKYLNELERTQWYSEEEIREIQLNKIKKLIHYAFRNVPFYKRAMTLRKIAPEDFNNFDDLKHFPIVYKKDIQDESHLFRSDKQGLFPRRKTTAGSTGQPVTVYKDAKASAYERAAMYRAYRWWGIDIGHKQARFWG